MQVIFQQLDPTRGWPSKTIFTRQTARYQTREDESVGSRSCNCEACLETLISLLFLEV